MKHDSSGTWHRKRSWSPVVPHRRLRGNKRDCSNNSEASRESVKIVRMWAHASILYSASIETVNDQIRIANRIMV